MRRRQRPTVGLFPFKPAVPGALTNVQHLDYLYPIISKPRTTDYKVQICCATIKFREEVSLFFVQVSSYTYRCVHKYMLAVYYSLYKPIVTLVTQADKRFSRSQDVQLIATESSTLTKSKPLLKVSVVNQKNENVTQNLYTELYTAIMVLSAQRKTIDNKLNTTTTRYDIMNTIPYSKLKESFSLIQ